MFCDKCGNQLSNDAKFCKSCGATVSSLTDVAESAPVVEKISVTSVDEPVTTVEKKPETKDCRFKMLLMTFITFLCLTLLPLFNFANLGNISLNATDIVKISAMGMEFTSVEEGELVENMRQKIAQSIEEEEDPQAKVLISELGTVMLNLVQKIEPKLVMMNKVFVGLMAATVVVVLGFAVMLFSVIKNKKKIYQIANIAVLAVLAVVSFAAIKYTNLGIGLIGSGMWATILMLALSCYIPFKKEKNKAK